MLENLIKHKHFYQERNFQNVVYKIAAIVPPTQCNHIVLANEGEKPTLHYFIVVISTDISGLFDISNDIARGWLAVIRSS